MTKNFISKTQAEADQKMRELLNNKYKKQVNELLHGDINVIDGEIIITKWGGSNNRLVFQTEDELQTYINGVIGGQLADQWQQYQKDLTHIIGRCNYYIQLVKDNPEYFSDDFDYDMIEGFTFIKDTLFKYIN